MEYIKDADDRAKAEEEKDQKTDLVKKEAVRRLWNDERKAKAKTKWTFWEIITENYPLDLFGHMTMNLYLQRSPN